jgi:hypothetical protein
MNRSFRTTRVAVLDTFKPGARPCPETSMKLPRRQFLHLAAAAAALPAMSRFAWAQTYPTRPITMIVPLAAGAGWMQPHEFLPTE